MTKGSQLTLVVVLLGLFALFYQGLWGDPRHIPTVLIGTDAPMVEGPDVETGQTISLEQFKGKVILLNFWASWCYECKVEHESVLQLHQLFKDDPNFVMLGINYQDKLPDAKKYLKEYGTTFSHMRDLKGQLAIDYGVYGVPETFVIDQQGKIRYKYVGPVTGHMYTTITQNVIAPLLKGEPISTPS
jgi:cytochrome c biogenesis protein CcmG/thiol:disulfide interchange protein DsbE